MRTVAQDDPHTSTGSPPSRSAFALEEHDCTDVDPSSGAGPLRVATANVCTLSPMKLNGKKNAAATVQNNCAHSNLGLLQAGRSSIIERMLFEADLAIIGVQECRLPSSGRRVGDKYVMFMSGADEKGASALMSGCGRTSPTSSSPR